MRKMTVIALLIIASLWATVESAHAQSACDTYRVKPGDSLRNIAARAYGDDDFKMIYRENAAEIGRNPDLIKVGIVLRLPCPESDDPAAVETVVEATDDPMVISFVTANGYLPYTDESLPGQGIITTLVERAMLRANPEQPYTVTFVNDWAAHLEALLPSMAFDASFPWTRPGCETQKGLTALEFYSCQQYIYSDPFYEIVDSFFARTGTGYETTTDYADFKGAKLCRPEGYSTSHLAEQGLMPPEIGLTQPESVGDCFDLLMTGRVDIVSLDARTAVHAVNELGLRGQVSENPALNSILPLQIVAHSENPKAKELIDTLNRGVREMHQSGEWHAIISEALKVEVKEQLGVAMN